MDFFESTAWDYLTHLADDIGRIRGRIKKDLRKIGFDHYAAAVRNLTGIRLRYIESRNGYGIEQVFDNNTAVVCYWKK